MALNLKRLENPINRIERQGINDNWAKIEKNFNGVVELVSSEAFDKVVDSAKLIWQAPVNTFADLATTYPNAEEGWAAWVSESINGVNKAYRYDGAQWVLHQEFIGNAINEVDNRINERIDEDQKLNATMIINKQQPRNHSAFTSVTYNPGTQKYHAVYRGGESHVDETGEILYTESVDGKEWSVPRTIINTGLDDRDPSIATLKDNTMIVNFFVYNGGRGTVYTSKSVDGQVWSNPKAINAEQYEFCSAPIVQLVNDNLLLPVYGGQVLKFYVSYDLGDNWSYLSMVPGGAGNPSEQELLIVDENNLLCIIRSDASDSSPIYYSRSSDKGVSWSNPIATTAVGKPGGVIRDGQDVYVGVRVLKKYVYYGESWIYKFDLDTMAETGRTFIDTSYDYDTGYFGFASKDSKELVITYYSKLLNSGAEVKLLYTNFEIFKNKHKLLNAEHSLNSHTKPYYLSDGNGGHPVLTLEQENVNGDYVRLINELGEVSGILTSNAAKMLILNNPAGGVHISQNGNTIFFGNGAGEINGLGSLVWRKNQDLRGITAMQDGRVLRVNGDTSSGLVYVQRLDVATSNTRPSGVTVGYQVWDTTLQRPIYWSGTQWKNSEGVVV